VESSSHPELARDVLIPRPPFRAAPRARTEIELHPRAVVETGAVLGPGSCIGPGAFVGPEVQLGANVRVGANAVLTGRLTIGDDVRIEPCAVLGAEPQDLAFDGGDGGDTGVVIGDRAWIREGVTVHRATRGGTDTVVGDDVLLMANSHVAHDCRVESGAILSNGVLLAGHVHVGPRALLSGNAVVHQFVRIGTLAIVGGASRVNRDVPPYAMLVGDSRLRGLNRVGLERAGVDATSRAELRELYRILRTSPNPVQALEAVGRRARTPEGMELLRFLSEESRRGFCRFGRC